MNVHSYKLRNAKYNLDAANITPGKPIIVGSSTVKNGRDEAIVKNDYQVSWKRTLQQSVETTVGLTAGMSLTVEGGVTVGIASVSTQVASWMEQGFEHKTGQQSTEEVGGQETAHLNVKPHTQCTVEVVATEQEIDVTFTADLIEMREEGKSTREGKTSKITAVYHGLFFSAFDINYKACEPYTP